MGLTSCQAFDFFYVQGGGGEPGAVVGVITVCLESGVWIMYE